MATRGNDTSEPVDRLIWQTDDPILPPLVRIEDPVLAATIGCLLSIKGGLSYTPHGLYNLEADYMKFKELCMMGVKCYVVNTGHFGAKKVTKSMTQNILEDIMKERASFIEWSLIDSTSLMNIEGFMPDDNNEDYVCGLLKFFICGRDKNGLHHDAHLASKEKLPDEGLRKLKAVQRRLKERAKSINYQNACQCLGPYF